MTMSRPLRERQAMGRHPRLSSDTYMHTYIKKEGDRDRNGVGGGWREPEVWEMRHLSLSHTACGFSNLMLGLQYPTLYIFLTHPLPMCSGLFCLLGTSVFLFLTLKQEQQQPDLCVVSSTHGARHDHTLLDIPAHPVPTTQE